MKIILLVGLINFIGAFFQGATGFGYALISMGLMPLIIPVSHGAAICAVNGVAVGIQMVITLRRHVNMRVVTIPVLCCFATINIGLYILNNYNELLLRLILAVLMIMVTVLFVFMRRKKIVIPNRWYIAMAFGLVTGVSTGMFSIIGPFLMIYYMNVCDDALELKACLEFSFMSVCLYTAFMHYWVYGTISAETAPQIVSAVVAALLAGFLGLKVYRKINKDIIAKIIYVLLPIMAVNLIINAF